ncbi:MAG: hypothetical protein N2234_04995 [Planctomycetota bacterium]|nr:hypothetical protein [Planctomycetota bacterium]
MALLRILLLIALCGIILWFYYSFRSSAAAEAETKILTEKTTLLKNQLQNANNTLKELEMRKTELYAERKTLAEKLNSLLERSIQLQRQWLEIKCELVRYKTLKEQIDSLTQRAETLLRSIQ